MNETGTEPTRLSWVFIFQVLAVALLPFILYVETLNAGFIWDDHILIESRAQSGTFPGLKQIWTQNFWQLDPQKNPSAYYRPLTSTTFLIDYHLHGANPRGYHFTNLLIYSGTCLLAFFLFRRLLASRPLAFSIALLFSSLPSHTENVSWISGRTDLVCALFLFGSLLVYFFADDTDRPRDFAISILLFVLALFGKEMAITLPAVIGLHQLMKRGVNKKSVLVIMAYSATALVFWVIHAAISPKGAPENIFLTPGDRALNVIRNLGLGIYYSLVPGGFELLITGAREQAAKTFPLPSGLGLLVVLLPLLLVLFGIALAVWRRQKLLTLALASGLIALIPVSGLVPIGVVFAIRFLFIPGFFFLLAVGLLLDKIPKRRLSLAGFKLHATAIALVPFILTYGSITVYHTHKWQSDEKLMRWVLEKEPASPLAHFFLGHALSGQKYFNPEAIEHYQKAVELRDKYEEAEYYLAVHLAREGRVEEAISAYENLLADYPSNRAGRGELIKLLLSVGREREARAVYEDGEKAARTP